MTRLVFLYILTAISITLELVFPAYQYYVMSFHIGFCLCFILVAFSELLKAERKR